jgi:hypothetical protein
MNRYFLSCFLITSCFAQSHVYAPAEYHAYQVFTAQTDANAKAAAGESFLTAYPQSVVEIEVLESLIDTYDEIPDPDKALSAASRLLQIDPDNMKALFTSIFFMKQQCAKTSDVQICDDAAAQAQKGLSAPKPPHFSDADWSKQRPLAYSFFHSAIALDDALSKGDLKAAEDEYTSGLKLLSDDQTKTSGLYDTFLLARAYSQPGPAQNLRLACWLYARVWDFAPPIYKAQIEPELEYYYSKSHGSLDGLNDLKAQAMTSTFPPGNQVAGRRVPEVSPPF